ncbi:hypothetical protein BV25DRAFT_1819933 [Artomyces pyxidatus]|uniref:Uncharacterized protein n=1 Tax=Artomyces pyxidatus TaxID=48021 RepID=A0ACB8TEG0_9AGAM|nr:hypothetical protein BV25DRAFT_1819933 [Artomyces pyxidatus]
MARFRAFASDTSEDEDDNRASQPPQKSSASRARSHPASPPPPSHRDEDEDMSDDGSSEMDEKELYAPLALRKQDRNALVEGADGEIYHAHEIDEDGMLAGESSRSSSESPPPKARNGSTSIIPRARQIGLDEHKLHLMQASLFRVPEEAAALRQFNEETPGRFHLAQSLNRKHSRDSEGDGLRIPVQERASFAHDVEAIPFRPSRKYARVDISASAVTGTEGAVVDAGLSLGRSFRVGWGPGGTLVHLGQLCSPSSSSKITANSSVVTKTIVPFTESASDSSNLTSKLLSHHLHNNNISPIVFDGDGIPFANPSPTLSFASFASLFPSTDRSFEALLFRLGHALFDDIDLHLHDTVSVDVRNQVYAIRRKAALSSWLEDAVSPTVDAEVKADLSANPTSTAFRLLTGHQVDKACEVSMDGGNVKLATLISQAGGDEEYLEDMRAQLRIWREQRIDVHIDESMRKVYALLAGVVGVLEGSNGTGIEWCPDISIADRLDWKRVFGLHLWYEQPMDASIADVFDSYDQHWRSAPARVAPPIPWYLEAKSPHPTLPHTWRLTSDANPPDGLYSLMRLYADPACSLSAIFSPFSFGPSPSDFSIPWHLYILLSRCMRIRDFADRDDPGVDRSVSSEGGEEQEDQDVRVEGHSPSADLLASTYALQLEQMDLIQEAVFVLLHLEGSTGREKAIKDLLLRSAPKLDDYVTRGIAGSLRVPLSWINEAKAVFALDCGNIYEAYQLYLQAGLYNAAHELAVLELAPEAVIRDDLELLKTLFERIAGHPVDGWHVRGKAFLDYAEIMTQLPYLRAQVHDPDVVPDGSQAAALEELTNRVPKLIGILPDVLRDRGDPRHSVALSQMIAGLTRELDKVQPLALSSIQLRPVHVSEATKLSHAQSAAYAHFLKTLQAA